MEVLEPEEFLAEAQALAVGEKRKVRHLCGDASLVVYNNVDSWTGWCWRCHARGWVPKPQPSMSERLLRQQQQKDIDNAIRTVTAPEPRVTDLSAWPTAAKVWLYKAGLDATLIRRLGAYYHERTARVVLPVYDSDGALVFWQARDPEYPGSGRPKYISSPVPRGQVHVQYGFRDDGVEDTRPIVITEDILSAFKVAVSGAGSAYCIMGTVLGDHSVARLVGYSRRAITWFDADGPGTDARRSVYRGLTYVGLQCSHIITLKDCKAYCLREIRSLISEHRSQPLADLQGAQALLPDPQADQ